LDKKKLSILFSAILLVVTIYTLIPKKGEKRLQEFNGQTMGTISYTVKVISDKDLAFQHPIDSILKAFNLSLSTYIPASEISRLNQTRTLDEPSELMLEVLQSSDDVYQATDGAFDPTVGPLVNAWGFGPEEKKEMPDSATIDSLLLKVGFEKITYSRETVDIPENVELDFSAIAKGQAVDEIGRWLEAQNINDYMVEIGGEVRCRGKNDQSVSWKIGVEDPTVSKTERRLMAVATLKDQSLATSGNYRNYYKKDGKLYAHIIDPRTGFTAEHSLLSASVFAKDCMTADAYATAFMVMGMEESVKIVEADDNLEAIFIYQTPEAPDVYISTGMTDQVQLKEGF